MFCRFVHFCLLCVCVRGARERARPRQREIETGENRTTGVVLCIFVRVIVFCVYVCIHMCAWLCVSIPKPRSDGAGSVKIKHCIVYVRVYMSVVTVVK